MERIFVTRNEEETHRLGMAVGQLLFPGAVILLNGDLGAGKTVFARGVGRGLNVLTPVTSPTFTLLHAHAGRLPFYHFDLYRLDDEDDLYELGMDDYLGGDGVSLIEWAAKFALLSDGPNLQVTIEAAGLTERRIILASKNREYAVIIEQLIIGS